MLKAIDRMKTKPAHCRLTSIVADRLDFHLNKHVGVDESRNLHHAISKLHSGPSLAVDIHPYPRCGELHSVHISETLLIVVPQTLGSTDSLWNKLQTRPRKT